MNFTKVRHGLLLFGLLFQAAIPLCMIAKRQLILSCGEPFMLEVAIRDPRDFLMGHYIALTPTKPLPNALKDIPQNYLRYYCDQRYAQQLDSQLTQPDVLAVLRVRLWHGSALAEELLINGLPAYEYLRQLPSAPTAAKQETSPNALRFLALDNVMPFGGDVSAYAEGLHHEWKRTCTYLRLPLPEHIFWARVEEQLNAQPSQCPVMPKRLQQAQKMLVQWKDLWWLSNYTPVFPIFTGVPFPCTRPFPEQAHVYYSVLKTFCPELNQSSKIALEGVCDAVDASTIWNAAQQAFPNACWILQSHTLPRGIPAEAVILLTETRPSSPNIRWMSMKEQDPETCNSPFYLGRWKTLSLLPPLRPSPNPQALLTTLQTDPSKIHSPEWIQAYTETFATLALRTQTSEGRELANSLLLFCPKRTLWAAFEQCPTYTDYCTFVQQVSERQQSKHDILLGGWLQIETNLTHPPVPPRPEPPTAEALIQLGKTILHRTP